MTADRVRSDRVTSDRWVLLDLDGTLFDYQASEAAAVAAVLADGGIEATADVVSVYREVNARHWRALERGETTASDLRLARWADTFAHLGTAPTIDLPVLAERYLEHLAAGTHLVADADEVLRRLGDTHGIAYLTNGLADVQRPRLAASPIGAHADVVIISDEVGATKPDPAIFDAAFAAMGHPDRGDVVLVGDSLTADIAGGAAYGIDTVWFDPAGLGPGPAGGPQPTHRISELRQLLPLLGT